MHANLNFHGKEIEKEMEMEIFHSLNRYIIIIILNIAPIFRPMVILHIFAYRAQSANFP